MYQIVMHTLDLSFQANKKSIKDKKYSLNFILQIILIANHSILCHNSFTVKQFIQQHNNLPCLFKLFLEIKSLNSVPASFCDESAYPELVSLSKLSLGGVY